MADFIFPTAAELIAVAQEKMPRLTADRPAFQILPIRTTSDVLLIWEQMDNYTGLQQVRGLNGAPSRVKKVGVKRYLMEPGYYGEFQVIDERELTMRRQIGTWDSAVNISDLVMVAQDQLLGRRLDRIELIVWTLLTTGVFSVSTADGVIAHTDRFNIQTYTAVVPWGTVATATPLANFRDIQLLGRGKSTSFNGSSTAFMNRTTWNKLISNLNAADLFGRRTTGLSTYENIAEVNKLLLGDDLPSITIYDEGYLDDNNVFQLFIPNDKVVVVGKRPAGQTVGEYRMTRNANNGALQPGPYMKVIDRGELAVPRTIEVHDGHNGGPVLYFPGAIILMNV
jgi:hypothetical protein